MTIKILNIYQSGLGWSYLVEDLDTGRKLPLNNEAPPGSKPNPRPSDAEIIAEATAKFAIPDPVPVEPIVFNITTVSKATLIAEVKRRPNIHASDFGWTEGTVEP